MRRRKEPLLPAPLSDHARRVHSTGDRGSANEKLPSPGRARRRRAPRLARPGRPREHGTATGPTRPAVPSPSPCTGAGLWRRLRRSRGKLADTPSVVPGGTNHRPCSEPGPEGDPGRCLSTRSSHPTPPPYASSTCGVPESRRGQAGGGRRGERSSEPAHEVIRSLSLEEKVELLRSLRRGAPIALPVVGAVRPPVAQGPPRRSGWARAESQASFLRREEGAISARLVSARRDCLRAGRAWKCFVTG
jgi:hypothetical protein